MIARVQLEQAIGTVVHVQCNRLHVYGLLLRVDDNCVAIASRFVGASVLDEVCIPPSDIQFAEVVVAMRQCTRVIDGSWTDIEDVGD